MDIKENNERRRNCSRRPLASERDVLVVQSDLTERELWRERRSSVRVLSHPLPSYKIPGSRRARARETVNGGCRYRLSERRHGLQRSPTSCRPGRTLGLCDRPCGRCSRSCHRLQDSCARCVPFCYRYSSSAS